MRRLAVLLVLAAVAPAFGQRTGMYSNPSPPAPEALDRLNLRQAWRTYVPLDGFRDGLATVQMLDDLVLVQTRSGQLVAYGLADGALRWQISVGSYPGVILPVGSNKQHVFVCSGTRLLMLERATGAKKADFDLPTVAAAMPVADDRFLYIGSGTNRLMCYLQPGATLTSKGTAGSVPLPPGVLAKQTSAAETRYTPPAKEERPTPPAAMSAIDDVQRGVTKFGNEGSSGVQVAPSINVVQSVVKPYRLVDGGGTPSINVVQSVAKPYRLVDGGGTPSLAALRSMTQLNPVFAFGPRPVLEWELTIGSRLNQPAVLTRDALLVAAGSVVLALGKEDRKPYFSFAPPAMTTAAPAQFESTCYLPTADGSVYALGIESGRLLWRITSGGTVRRSPVATDEDIYLQPTDVGVERLNRQTGDLVWRNTEAARLLAANPKFVYAQDSSNRLLVLDRARGQRLALFDTHDFTVPVTNDTTDRLLLAANNGLLVCLHDREYATPQALRHEKPPAAVQQAPAGVRPAPASPGIEKPADEPKKPAVAPPKKADEPKKAEPPKKAGEKMDEEEKEEKPAPKKP